MNFIDIIDDSNRLSEIADELTDKTQTSFMRNICIMESIVLLYEVLHEVEKNVTYTLNMPMTIYKYII
jgi:hypothetical protein